MEEEDLGSAISVVVLEVLLAAATGPITGGAATLICVGSGIMSSLCKIMILKYSIIIAINLLSFTFTYKISVISKNQENKIEYKILIIIILVYVIVGFTLSMDW